jgi:hypothetical protein
MKNFKLNVVFQTDEHEEVPEEVVISLTNEELIKIKRLSNIANEENVVVRMDFTADKFLSCDEEVEYPINYSCLSIFPKHGDNLNKIYFYAENKFSARQTFETVFFILD